MPLSRRLTVVTVPSTSRTRSAARAAQGVGAPGRAQDAHHRAARGRRRRPARRAHRGRGRVAVADDRRRLQHQGRFVHACSSVCRSWRRRTWSLTFCPSRRTHPSPQTAASALSSVINRYAASLVQHHAELLPAMRAAVLADNLGPPAQHPDASPLRVQSLLRHAIGEVVCSGVVNVLLVTDSVEAVRRPSPSAPLAGGTGALTTRPCEPCRTSSSRACTTTFSPVRPASLYPSDQSHRLT